jgi:hypothetical protein
VAGEVDLLEAFRRSESSAISATGPTALWLNVSRFREVQLNTIAKKSKAELRRPKFR